MPCRGPGQKDMLAEIKNRILLTSYPERQNTSVDLLLLGTHTVHKIQNH